MLSFTLPGVLLPIDPGIDILLELDIAIIPGCTDWRKVKLEVIGDRLVDDGDTREGDNDRDLSNRSRRA